MSEELSYWSNLDETVVGAVFRDRCDNDYGWVLLARDRLGRFRSVEVDVSLASPRVAEAKLRMRLSNVSKTNSNKEFGLQGDEANFAIDLLALPKQHDLAKFHPNFRVLFEAESHYPARAVLKEIGPWLTSKDPNFVKEFQLFQFDQRLWELYLWTALREGGLDVEMCEAPDFHVRGIGVEFSIEATAVSESVAGPLAQYPMIGGAKDVEEFNKNYMPIKYGSALFNKLSRRSASGKRYWEEDIAVGKPFVLAVADFHRQASYGALGSMTYSNSAIWRYLYGLNVTWRKENGKLHINYESVQSHEYNGKSIPSGFFNLPDSENVSAVLFTNAATLGKFNRMGILAGYVVPGMKTFRIGMRVDPDPNAESGTPFRDEVGVSGYVENWADEIHVYHNPRAKIPAPREWFDGLQQHFFEDGKLKSMGGEGAVIASFTTYLVPRKELAERA